MQLISDISYYVVYIICLVCSFIKNRSIKGIAFIRLLLVLGLINEIIATCFKIMGREENFSHFIYIPAEYCLLTIFFRLQTDKKKLKQIMLTSIPTYLFLVFTLSTVFYKFESYPSIIYNLACVLSIIWITLILYDMEILFEIPIQRIPLFWILSGLLIFYSGVYFFNTAYTYIIPKDLRMALHLRVYINVTLNIILYSSWIYAFICSQKIKSYTYH